MALVTAVCGVFEVHADEGDVERLAQVVAERSGLTSVTRMFYENALAVCLSVRTLCRFTHVCMYVSTHSCICRYT